MRARSELAAHWLPIANTVAAIVISFPLLAPILLATGRPQWANLIYAAYDAVCHQWAFRSYFLFGPHGTYSLADLTHLVGPDQAYAFVGSPELGYKVAFCERDVAIYLAVLLGGLAYARWRTRVASLGLPTYCLLIAPMALDGFTQLFGLRESTVLLRTLTGALFGLASVWLIYPRMDDVIGAPRESRHVVALRERVDR